MRIPDSVNIRAGIALPSPGVNGVRLRGDILGAEEDSVYSVTSDHYRCFEDEIFAIPGVGSLETYDPIGHVEYDCTSDTYEDLAQEIEGVIAQITAILKRYT